MSNTLNILMPDPCNEIVKFSIVELRDLIVQRKLSSNEIVGAFLKQIEKVNPLINAVVSYDPELAIQNARKIDSIIARDKTTGPLFGIPCTIKDSFDTVDFKSAAGLLGRKNFIPKIDSSVVTKIKHAGAIILGKTNTSEMTMTFHTDNLVYGKTKNPHDLSKSSGGSSGGAAAIVAAFGSPFDVGSDTGGSIRWPAHSCGVAGLKASSGSISRAGNIIDYKSACQSLTQIGPIAKSAEDLEIIYNVISGPDNIDPYVFHQKASRTTAKNMKELRFAYFIDNGIYEPDSDTVETIENVVKFISSQKLNIQYGRPTGIEQTAKLQQSFLISGDWMERIFNKYGNRETCLNWIHEQPNPSSSDYIKIIEEVSNYRSSMLSFWNKFDVLICLVAPTPATHLDEQYKFGAFHSYTAAFNLTGWPSLVIRAGSSKDGLPIGVQLVAPHWHENTCFRVAKFLEAEFAN